MTLITQKRLETVLHFDRGDGDGTMYIQKFKVNLKFLGILFVRILAGIVVAYLWAVVVAYIFNIAAGVSLSYVDVIDRFYDTGPPRDERYFGSAGTIYGLAWRIGVIGAWGFIALGVIWGFSQGRLDFKRWLRRRHAKRTMLS